MRKTQEDTKIVEVQPLAVDTKTAASMLGIAAGTLANWRYGEKPRGPRWARYGNKVVYPVAEIRRYIDERTIDFDDEWPGCDAASRP